MHERDDTAHTVAPETAIRLVVMLYDGAIGALQEAMEAQENEDFDGCLKSINMAVDILSQLYLALNNENGGEIAGNLGKIYGYMISRLQRVTLTNDPQPAREILGLLYHLYESWRELDVKIASGKTDETLNQVIRVKEQRIA